MNEPKNKLTEEELKLIEETELFMKEVYSDPEVANAEPPADLQKKVFAEIRAREEAKREAELAEEKRKAEEALREEEVRKAEVVRSAEEQELIRLGKLYKKRKGYRKYFVLAAVLILAMLLGVTSFGEPKKMFEKLDWKIAGREQINVDSDDEDVNPTSNLSEDEAYQEIEDRFEVLAVRMNYLPKETEFLEMNIGESIQGIHLIYGKDNMVKVGMIIRPNYRTGSIGKDMEDNYIEEYVEGNEYTTITMRKYDVDGNEERWWVQFAYQETLYSLTIMNSSKEEVEMIVDNLYFP